MTTQEEEEQPISEFVREMYKEHQALLKAGVKNVYEKRRQKQ